MRAFPVDVCSHCPNRELPMGSYLSAEAVPSTPPPLNFALRFGVEATVSFTPQRHPWSSVTGCPCGVVSRVPRSPVFPVNLYLGSETSSDMIEFYGKHIRRFFSPPACSPEGLGHKGSSGQGDGVLAWPRGDHDQGWEQNDEEVSGSIPGRRRGTCKGPGAGLSLACWRNG